MALLKFRSFIPIGAGYHVVVAVMIEIAECSALRPEFIRDRIFLKVCSTKSCAPKGKTDNSKIIPRKGILFIASNGNASSNALSKTALWLLFIAIRRLT